MVHSWEKSLQALENALARLQQQDGNEEEGSSEGQGRDAMARERLLAQELQAVRAEVAASVSEVEAMVRRIEREAASGDKLSLLINSIVADM